MDVKEWMEVEYATQKRQQQGRSFGQHLGTKTFRVSTEAGDSYSNEPKEKSEEKEEVKTCPDCKHILINNQHGPDQNDFYMKDNNEVEHYGTCTYCKYCNPRLRLAMDK